VTVLGATLWHLKQIGNTQNSENAKQTGT